MNFNIYKKKFFLLFILFFIFINVPKSYSETLKSITVNGNERISDETIYSFLSIKLNDEFSENKLNLITKELYDTNFFKNVTLKYENNNLIIDVVENPIIQNIFFEGIKSNSLKDFVTNDVNLIERSSFINIYLEEDLEKMKQNLKSRGYYFSTIDVKIENLEDNKINIFYNFDIGDKAKISKITFVGNKIYKNKDLKNIIISEEYKFWKFISGKKFLNEELINIDKRLLRNFYLNRGFYNVEILSSYARLISDNEFELIFNINAGNKIFFGDLKLSLPLNYDKNNFLDLSVTLNKLSGTPYSINSINKIVEEIDNIALSEQYETIDVNVKENLDFNKLDLEFIISESEKSFIKKINILGNNVTRENVIRNKFEIDEGDFYNEILYNKTLNNLKSLNFFKDVKGKISNEINTNDKVIDIIVEEKPTGEIGASLGFATDDTNFGFFVKENNYLGKGIGLTGNVLVGTDRIKGLISVTNPNFNDTDKFVYTTIESTEINKLTDFGYKTNQTGFAFGTKFEILDDFTLGIGNSNYYEKIETDSTASALQKTQEGDYWDTFINLDFNYDKRNQKYKTSDGFRSNYNINIPVISQTNTLTNSYNLNHYSELYENNITSVSFFLKTANSLTDDNIKLTERLYLPSNKLRGFSNGGVGPKDGKDYIGGNYVSSINIASTLPQLTEQLENFDINVFMDVGNVWGVDYSSLINQSNKIRSSIGVSAEWLTPVGPLNFSLSEALTKADSDTTESFRFNLGTTF
jgi:outer membrane protein insertion porin family